MSRELEQYFKDFYEEDDVKSYFFQIISEEAKQKKMPLVHHCRYLYERSFNMGLNEKEICKEVKNTVASVVELKNILRANGITKFSNQNFKNALKILNERGDIFSNDDLCYAFFYRD